jgi:hypothetical protein
MDGSYSSVLHCVSLLDSRVECGEFNSGLSHFMMLWTVLSSGCQKCPRISLSPLKLILTVAILNLLI